MTRTFTVNSWTSRSDAEVEVAAVPVHPAAGDLAEDAPVLRPAQVGQAAEEAAVARVVVAVDPPVRVPAIVAVQQAVDLAQGPLTAVEGMIQVQVQVQPTTASIPTTPTVHPIGLGSSRRTTRRGLREPSRHRDIQRLRLRRLTDTMPVARVHPTLPARGLL